MGFLFLEGLRSFFGMASFFLCIRSGFFLGSGFVFLGFWGVGFFIITENGFQGVDDFCLALGVHLHYLVGGGFAVSVWGVVAFYLFFPTFVILILDGRPSVIFFILPYLLFGPICFAALAVSGC